MSVSPFHGRPFEISEQRVRRYRDDRDRGLHRIVDSRRLRNRYVRSRSERDGTPRLLLDGEMAGVTF